MLSNLSDVGNREHRTIRCVSIDITNRCNLCCPHCIISLQERNAGHELEFQFFKKQLPALIKQGCFEVKLCGGEPLLHRDFRDIYLFIKKQGVKVTLFTNGVLLDKEMLDFFKRYPLSKLVVTLYGASDDDYSKLSFNKEIGLFSRAHKAIKILPQTGIPFLVQCHAFKHRPEVDKELKQVIDFLPVIPKKNRIYPRSMEDKTNMGCMSSLFEEGVLEKDMQKLSIARAKNKKDSSLLLLSQGKFLYACSAGFRYLHITADRKVTPCVFYREDKFDLEKYPLEEILFKKIPKLLQQKIPQKSPCYNCYIRENCNACLAYAFGSVGFNPLRIQLCQITEKRRPSRVAKDGI